MKKVTLTTLMVATIAMTSFATTALAADGGEYKSKSQTSFFGEYEAKTSETETEAEAEAPSTPAKPGKVIPHTGNTNQASTMATGMLMLSGMVAIVLTKTKK